MSIRLVHCGRDGLAAAALDAAELEGVHRAMDAFASTELIPQLLATIEALRAPDGYVDRLADFIVDHIGRPYTAAECGHILEIEPAS